MVLEAQPYLFAFASAKFGAFIAFFGPLGAIFRVEVRFKNIFGTYQIFTFLTWLITNMGWESGPIITKFTGNMN